MPKYYKAAFSFDEFNIFRGFVEQLLLNLIFHGDLTSPLSAEFATPLQYFIN
jgi:hypothetical protein